MDWAIFRKDLKETNYKKGKKYAIQSEDKDYIYVSLKKNCRNDNQVTRFRKIDQPDLFDIKENMWN